MEGSIAVEYIFNRQGIGWWLANAAISLDIPVLMSICLFGRGFRTRQSGPRYSLRLYRSSDKAELNDGGNENILLTPSTLRELKFTLRRIFRNPSAIIGFTLLLFFTAVAVFAPYMAPPKYQHNPYQMPHKGYSQTPKPPSQATLFGTTSGQYDIFYGVVWGTRTAFKIGIFVIGIAIIIGVALGIISGYYGGIMDEIIMRIVDIIFAIPASGIDDGHCCRFRARSR